jgi:hypothetical protein
MHYMQQPPWAHHSSFTRALKPPQLEDMLPQPCTAHAALDPVQQELPQARQVKLTEQLGQGDACSGRRFRLAAHRLALILIRRTGELQMAARRRFFAAHPVFALALLCPAASYP